MSRATTLSAALPTELRVITSVVIVNAVVGVVAGCAPTPPSRTPAALVVTLRVLRAWTRATALRKGTPMA